jgi:hypothetical protein
LAAGAGEGFAAGARLAAAAGSDNPAIKTAEESKLATFLWAFIVQKSSWFWNIGTPMQIAETVKPGLGRFVSPDSSCQDHPQRCRNFSGALCLSTIGCGDPPESSGRIAYCPIGPTAA